MPIKLVAILSLLVGLLISTSAEARKYHRSHYQHQVSLSHSIVCDQWGCRGGERIKASRRAVRTAYKAPRPVLDANGGATIIAHPPGCPGRAFCGCGASVRIFGHPVRSLFLASNWGRFPSASPAPGMAAYRSGHVFVIEQVNSDGTVLATDYNSGGHMSRRHTVSLRGYRVVNPHGGRYALM